ncbi:hypothetical protein [Coxiella-like endosymbiont]|uniref:hypothetical protein n=1 Tax=Coxiella-like endosymbiont TaxID=1592897 RepID=UPI0027297325|nr:hypothetical protein [Coxiella-like endosymbiont]
MYDVLMTRFSQKTFRETFIYLKQFKIGESIANIQCPCLSIVGKGKTEEAERQFKAFCEGVLSGSVTSSCEV